MFFGCALRSSPKIVHKHLFEVLYGYVKVTARKFCYT